MRLSTTETNEKYRDTIFRAAFSICRSREDAEDAVQEAFLRYHTSQTELLSEEHLRVWIIRVTVNLSKNIVTSLWHRNQASWEEAMAEIPFEAPEDSGLMTAVLRLSTRYRIIVHLYYYEEYAVKEIAELLKISENTVKSQLFRARKLLKQALKEEWQDD